MACPGSPLTLATEDREDDGAAPVNERRELLDREKRPLGVEVEHLVVNGLGDVREWRWGTEPRVHEKQVDGVELALHLSSEGIDIDQ